MKSVDEEFNELQIIFGEMELIEITRNYIQVRMYDVTFSVQEMQKALDVGLELVLSNSSGNAYAFKRVRTI